MIGVLACALLAACLRSEEGRAALIYYTGPVCGVLVHRSLGGRGIIGGAIGGGMSYLVIGSVLYFSNPGTDLVGPFLGIPVFSFLGATIGLVVGVVIWGLKLEIDDKDSRYPWSPPADRSKPKIPE
jgi:hypothetical protein